MTLAILVMKNTLSGELADERLPLEQICQLLLHTISFMVVSVFKWNGESEGSKRNWRRLSTRFDCIKGKFQVLFNAAALLTNFLHWRRQNFAMEVSDEATSDGQGAWDGDF